MSPRRIVMVGAEHRALAEQLHEEIADALQAIACGELGTDLPTLASETRLLRTCARTELYMVSADTAATIRAVCTLLDAEVRSELPALSHLRFATSAAAVRHLFRTASGLESAVVGEAEVLGQVRDVLRSPSGQTASPVLHRLFQEAVEVGRRVRTQTGLGEGGASLSSAAVSWAEERLAHTHEPKALVVGAGRTGRALAHRLAAGPWARVAIANRTLERATCLAAETGASAHDLHALPELLAESDVVFAAVPAPAPIILRSAVERARGQRPGASRLLVDLSHPHAIERGEHGEGGGEDELNLSTLQDHVEQARTERARWIPEVETYVEAAVDGYVGWLHGRGTMPLLVELREHVLTSALAHAERAGRGLPPEERERLRRLARSIGRSVLHQPTRALREAGTEENLRLADAVRKLFDLPAEADELEQEPATEPLR